MREVLFCRNCGQEALAAETKHGRRDSCEDCGWWSWGGKPLVPAEVHAARIETHEAVDRLWRTAAVVAYDVHEEEGTEAHEKAVARIQKAARARTYAYLADRLGLPRRQFHVATIEDTKLLGAARVVALASNAITIRRWWHEEGKRKKNTGGSDG